VNPVSPTFLTTIKSVAFQYETEERVTRLLTTFRMMVNHAIWAGMQGGFRSRFSLIKAVYKDFKKYGLHSHYTLNACEVAAAILKNHRRNHRAPVAKKLFLKFDKQTYLLQKETLRIPIKPREFLVLKLRLGDYQSRFLDDPSLTLGSITLTEDKVTVTFKKEEANGFEYRAVTAYDTNELSLDGAFSDGSTVQAIHINLKKIARVRAFHFRRRRNLQARFAHCHRKLRTKMAECEKKEQRRVNAVLHIVTKRLITLAKQSEAEVVLEDLSGIRRTINKRKLNYSGRVRTSLPRSRHLKRRLNTWSFGRLHTFIQYKAAWEGVPLAFVPARYSSRTCPKCGCLLSGEQDPSKRRIFVCPDCGWTCNRHLNAAFNLLKTQDEGRWFSPDRLLNEVMTSEPTRRKLSHNGLAEPTLTS